MKKKATSLPGQLIFLKRDPAPPILFELKRIDPWAIQSS